MSREKNIIISVFHHARQRMRRNPVQKRTPMEFFVTVYLHQYVKQIQGSDRAAPECGGRNRATGS